jgi:hypothetical protein
MILIRGNIGENIGGGGSTLEDVESAALANESHAIEFDDDMMVPELASHMQKNHDTIDRQMHIQKDILAELKDGLRSDLDGLKIMLAAASHDFTNSMSASKKTEMLVAKLKADVSARGIFETAFQGDQMRVLGAFSRLQQLLAGGSAQITEQIIQQISEKADASYEQGRVAATVSSSVLEELTAELHSIVHMIDSSIVPAITEEEQRYKNAEKSFLHMIKNNGVTLPTSVLDQLQSCTSVDSDTDEAVRLLARKLKVIASQIPAVVTALTTAQNVLGRVLMNALEIGNPDIGDKEKNVQNLAITSRLLAIQEMFTFLHHEEDEEGEEDSPPTLAACVSTASVRRRELELILDNFLQAAATKSNQKSRPKKKKKAVAKKSTGSESGSNSDSSSSSSSSSSDSDSDSGEDDTPAPAKKGPLGNMKRRGSQMYLKVEHDVKDNKNLSEAQRSELLDTVVQDEAFVDNMLAVARENKAARMTPLAEGGGRPESGGDKEEQMARRHQDEQDQLAKKIRTQHFRRLNSIMHSEAVAIASDDPESLQESMALTFAGTKYAILMRRHGARCRILFTALHDTFELQRVALLRAFVDEMRDTDSAASGNASGGGGGGGGDKHMAARQHMEQLESAMEGVNSAERVALGALQEELQLARVSVEEQQDAVSEAWGGGGWRTVQLSEEMRRLREETAEDFHQLKNSLNENSSQAKQCADSKQSLTTALVQQRIGRFDDIIQGPILECLGQESSFQLQVIEEQSKENFHVLAMVEQQVEKMLELCTAWGPLVNSQLMQDKLHERMIASLHSYHDGLHRIAENASNLST